MAFLTLCTELSLKATNSKSGGSGARTLSPSGIIGQLFTPGSLITVSVDFSYSEGSYWKRAWLIRLIVPHLRHGLRVAPQAEKPYLDSDSKTRKEALHQEKSGN
jgi:hypothetical protein